MFLSSLISLYDRKERRKKFLGVDPPLAGFASFMHLLYEMNDGTVASYLCDLS